MFAASGLQRYVYNRVHMCIDIYMCKDILGSYTYVRLVSAQAHSFTRPHESEVNTEMAAAHTYKHIDM